MTAQPLWAVVPVKRFAEAKMRLADVLSSRDRAALAEAMMRDVLQSTCACPAVAGVAVVTCDPKAAEIAAAAGALVVKTRADEGHTAAAEAGVAALGALPASVLVVSTDIPGVRPEDLSQLVSLHGPEKAVTLARAAADGGTNALVVTPPDVIDFHFGADSEARHTHAAREAGVVLQAVTIARMAYDLDRPEDVVRFLARPSATMTYRLLRDLEASGHMAAAVREGELS